MERYREILKRYWGYDDFRSLQGDIIKSVGEGRDTLGLMPTGGGKSITFQVPAMAMEGLCIVVTPLIALMKDQVFNLREKGIKAVAVYSGMTKHEIEVALDNATLGDYKFLYVSPERLDTDAFRERLKRMHVCLLAVDESHCISQWGYDFRPSYLKIAEVRDFLKGVPVLALTATATPEVVDDIQNKLHFTKKNVFKKSFARKNIAYIVRKTEDKLGRMMRILQSVPGTSIVYVRSRRRTKEISDFLNENGETADFYHAGLSNETKDQRQMAWKSGECRVIVATNAFGMGIDKPDVRTVIHIDLPDTLEAYFQEAGRAGRDEQQAYAVLLYNKSDNAKLKKRVLDSFPDKEFIVRTYEAVCNYLEVGVENGAGRTFDFSLADFCTKFHLPMIQAYSALKIIQQSGYIELTEEEDSKSRVMFIIHRDGLYDLKLKDKFVDDLMKVLLRSYTGLFSEYAYIDEAYLSKKLNAKRDEVYQGLLYLSRQHVISYVPGKKTPFLIFTRSRVPNERLFITKEAYEERKERFESKIGYVLEYAEAENRCRSRMLLHYFGEEGAPECGCCDYCLNKKKYALTTKDYEALRGAIIDTLREKRLSPTAVLSAIKGDEEQLIRIMREMLDREELKLDDFGRLTLNL